MSDTTYNEEDIIDVIPEQAMNKKDIRAGKGMVIHKGKDLETKPHDTAKDDGKPGFLKGTVFPIFYKNKKVTPVGYMAGATIATLGVVSYMKLKKERDWSRQRVAVGTKITPLILNTDSSHIKGLLHV